MAQIPECADVRDDKRDSELILRAHLPEVDAPVFDGQTAAAAVITELRDLILQRFVLEVVAHPGYEVKAFARFAAVPNKRSNLVRKRLLEVRRRGRGIIVQTKVGSSDEKLSIRLYLQEGADGDESLDLRVVLHNLFQVVRAAGRGYQIDDHRQRVGPAKR